MNKPYLKKEPHQQPRGQATIEFALVIPILLAILYFVTAFSVVFYAYVTMQMAVREGTNAVVHNPRQTVSQIQNTVRSYVVTLDQGQLNVIVEPADPSLWLPGVQVSVSGIYTVNLPIQALGPIQFKTTSVMTIE